jgi:hypothetical protein
LFFVVAVVVGRSIAAVQSAGCGMAIVLSIECWTSKQISIWIEGRKERKKEVLCHHSSHWNK